MTLLLCRRPPSSQSSLLWSQSSLPLSRGAFLLLEASTRETRTYYIRRRSSPRRCCRSVCQSVHLCQRCAPFRNITSLFQNDESKVQRKRYFEILLYSMLQGDQLCMTLKCVCCRIREQILHGGPDCTYPFLPKLQDFRFSHAFNSITQLVLH